MPALADEPLLPTAQDIRVATELISELNSARGNRRPKFLLSSNKGEQTELSEGAYVLLVKILEEMSKGNGIMVMPIHAELTTQQAADFLNVSRPFLIGLLEKGELPFRTVGRHRRVRLEDMMKYKKLNDEKRMAALDELVAQAQELNLGYGR